MSFKIICLGDVECVSFIPADRFVLYNFTLQISYVLIHGGLCRIDQYSHTAKPVDNGLLPVPLEMSPFWVRAAPKI